uniref:Uncharacterized protein n=1 Tax=Solanum tuberosum TaxID=4113 RepID=M1C6K8_SOLTU
MPVLGTLCEKWKYIASCRISYQATRYQICSHRVYRKGAQGTCRSECQVPV